MNDGLSKRRFKAWNFVDNLCRRIDQAGQYTGHGRDQHSEEDGSVHPEHHQNDGDDYSEDRQQHRTAVDVSERHERARIRHDNFRTLKTDKCNEKADAGADCQFKLRRNGIDDFPSSLLMIDRQK